MKYKELYILLFLLLSLNNYAQVHIEADTTHIRIGEQIRYEIVSDSTKQVVFPDLVLDSLGKVEVVHSFPVDTLKNKLYKKYLLTAFDSGTYRIPAQDILINNAHYFTDSLLIQVATVAVDTTKQKLYPIKSIYKAPPKTWRDYIAYLWWILGVLAALGLIAWWAFGNKKQRVKRQKAQQSPIEEALYHFSELDSKKLPEQHKIKEYYIELTDIVREYIGKDVHIPTLEVTTDELISLLSLHNKSKNIGIDKERIRQLHQFLKDADLVKFAKAKPDTSKIEEDRKTAETIVQDIQAVVHKPKLDEFGNEIVEVSPEEIAEKEMKKRRKKALIAAAVLALLILSFSSWYYGIRYVKDTIIGHPTKELLEGKWLRSSYGHPAISLESPKILKAITIELPEQAKIAIQSNSFFQYGSLFSNFYIMIGSVEYNPEVQTDIDGAVTGAIANLQNQKGISNLQYQTENMEKEGVEGRRITGSLLVNGIESKLRVEMFAQANTLEQIVVVYRSDDPYAEKIQERLFQSVHLEKVTAEEEDTETEE